MAELSLLVIEDEPESMQPILDDIEASDLPVSSNMCHFSEAQTAIQSSPPDIIILDLLDGDEIVEEFAPGLGVRDFIWEKHFCPLIVHSAEPEHHSDSADEHPFVITIRKGRASPGQVIEALEYFVPHMLALRKAGASMTDAFEKSVAGAMRDVAPLVFQDTTLPEQQTDLIARAGTRRLAVLMDQQMMGNVLAPWEVYLCPPVTDDILLGDIFRRIPQNSGPQNGAEKGPLGNEEWGAEDFSVVVTPSCDLVVNDQREAKVSSVLMAQCCSAKEGLGRAGVKLPKKRELAAKRLISSLLSPGHANGVVPFPRYGDKIPTMSVDLKKLLLVPFDDLTDGLKFQRVASIDSPFRELISWAYMQVACRPGLPMRDVDVWANEVLSDM